MPAPPPTAEESITLPRVYQPQSAPMGGGELAVEFAVVSFFSGVFFAVAYFATSDLFMACAAFGGFILCFVIVALIAWLRFPKSIQTIEIRDDGVVLNLRGGTQKFIRRESLRSIRTLTLWEYFFSCYITPHHRPGSLYYFRQYRIDHSEGFICFRPRGDDSFAPMIRALLQPSDPDRPISLPATSIGTPRELNLHTGTLCTISAVGIAHFLFTGFLWGWLFFERKGDFASLYDARNYAELAKRFVIPFATCVTLLSGFLVALVFSWTEKRGASLLVLGCVGVASVAFVTEIYLRMWQSRFYISFGTLLRARYINWWSFRGGTLTSVATDAIVLVVMTGLAIFISRRLADRQMKSFRSCGPIDSNTGIS